MRTGVCDGNWYPPIGVITIGDDHVDLDHERMRPFGIPRDRRIRQRRRILPVPEAKLHCEQKPARGHAFDRATLRESRIVGHEVGSVLHANHERKVSVIVPPSSSSRNGPRILSPTTSPSHTHVARVDPYMRTTTVSPYVGGSCTCTESA